MNRLSPWIVRRPSALAVAAALPASPALGVDPVGEWLGDLRLFIEGWVGGVIFFGTLIG